MLSSASSVAGAGPASAAYKSLPVFAIAALMVFVRLILAASRSVLIPATLALSSARSVAVSAVAPTNRRARVRDCRLGGCHVGIVRVVVHTFNRGAGGRDGTVRRRPLRRGIHQRLLSRGNASLCGILVFLCGSLSFSLRQPVLPQPPSPLPPLRSWRPFRRRTPIARDHQPHPASKTATTAAADSFFNVAISRVSPW